MRNAFRLLQLAGERFTATEGRRHSLVIIDGDLKLVLMIGSYVQIVNIETMDLDRSPDEIMGDVVRLTGEVEPEAPVE